MKKIAFLMASPFTKGGEQRIVTVVSNSLQEAGYDVTILCTDPDPVNYDLYHLNKKVHIKYVEAYYKDPNVINSRIKRDKMNAENANTGKYKHFFWIQKYFICDRLVSKVLSDAINEEDFDYVISVSTMFNTMLAVIADKIRAKTIGWQHSMYDVYFETPGIRHYNQDKFSKYMFKKLDRYVVLSRYDQEKLKEKFHADSVVIHNMNPIDVKSPSQLDKKHFLALGRFVKVKNFELLIDMFYEFHKRNKEWILDIYGEGPLKEALEKKIQEYHLSKFVLLHSYEEDISKCYLNSSIHLVTSQYEGWSLVTTEAMEYGLPTISFDIPCIAERIEDGKNGYLIKRYDQEDFVEKMLLLANDPEKIKEMGKNAREYCHSNPNSQILNQWIQLFNELEK